MTLVAGARGLALVQRDISGELEASLGNGGSRRGKGEDGESELHLEDVKASGSLRGRQG